MGTTLVVDDDRKTVALVRLYLERDGLAALAAHDGAQALELARTSEPDLIVLDLMLPRLDGLDVCQVLRERSSVPIIMLTARSTEEDTLAGLEVGANDDLTKPLSPRELVARARAVLRHARDEGEGNGPVARVGDLEFDVPGRECVSAAGRWR